MSQPSLCVTLSLSLPSNNRIGKWYILILPYQYILSSYWHTHWFHLPVSIFLCPTSLVSWACTESMIASPWNPPWIHQLINFVVVYSVFWSCWQFCLIQVWFYEAGQSWCCLLVPLFGHHLDGDYSKEVQTCAQTELMTVSHSGMAILFSSNLYNVNWTIVVTLIFSPYSRIFHYTNNKNGRQ